VILAGGSGTRLWPASRRLRPKQFLPFGGNGRTLLAAAVERGRCVAGEHVVIVTAEDQIAATREAVPGVELIGEPVGKNTAPAIGLAAATIAARDPDAVLVVLPADQHVADEAGLARVLELGCGAVERDDAIGTVGITPTRAETGFGYLEVAAATPDTVVPVLRFVEKPDRATAERYVAAGTYLWNAGMFFASAKRFLGELDVHAPSIAAAVRDIAGRKAEPRDVYPGLPSISIDHAVMERATRVVTIPASVGWDDIGSWAAMATLLGVKDGNTIEGNVVVLDGTGNVVMSDDATLIATIGISDHVIVKSGDAILVIPKSAAQDVRKVVDALSARGLARYL
jgi:mannose-1-phosphate guanylyltransferase